MSLDVINLFGISTVHNDSWIEGGGEEGLVSVVVPTYNRADFLVEAAQSVFDQTYRPIELLIADDGSTDNTASVVEQLEKQVKEMPGLTIRYLYQSSRGAPAARNLGLLASQGAFIHHLDSDDVLAPRAIEAKVQALERTGAAFAWSPVKPFENETLLQFENDGESASETTVVTCPTQASHPEAILFRRKACRAVGPWRESLERMQDWEYAFRIAGLNMKGAMIKTALYGSRKHEQGSIADVLHQPEGISIDLKSLEAIEDVLAKTPRPCSRMVYTTFWLYLKALRRALKLGTDEEIRQCFRGLRRNSQTWIRTVRVEVVRGIFELLGRSVPRFLIGAYIRRK
ncbi:glycosyltransferase family 2 protein [Salinibacter ruber]|uniref:glycosyltransferase family 2 protein n=1 Tax=Salinibacter ruber TaxID=146919 RepID=UPI002168572A|nr:glycosyltransferase family A protein [Salinibacter ruber]MCS3685484.1 glycosyltransferase involved in cell wall biosynthesis [Salinibacter ruber]